MCEYDYTIVSQPWFIRFAVDQFLNLHNTGLPVVVPGHLSKLHHTVLPAVLWATFPSFVTVLAYWLVRCYFSVPQNNTDLLLVLQTIFCNIDIAFVLWVTFER